jgi:hypothetical protein
MLRGNLAVMSVRANRAKGGLSFEQVLAAARAERPVGELRPEQSQISGQLAGGRRVTPASLAPWRMSSRGHLQVRACA